jgi:hypothetical protein
MKLFIGVIIGGILGYSYYHFVGCRSGHCPIAGNPYISILYGSLMGAVFMGGRN